MSLTLNLSPSFYTSLRRYKASLHLHLFPTTSFHGHPIFQSKSALRFPRRSLPNPFCRSYVHLRSLRRGHPIRFSPTQAPDRRPHLSQSPSRRYFGKHYHLFPLNSHRSSKDRPFENYYHNDREGCTARGRNGVARVLATPKCYQAFCFTSLCFGMQFFSPLDDRGTQFVLTGPHSISPVPHLADASQV